MIVLLDCVRLFDGVFARRCYCCVLLFFVGVVIVMVVMIVLVRGVVVFSLLVSLLSLVSSFVFVILFLCC